MLARIFQICGCLIGGSIVRTFATLHCLDWGAPSQHGVSTDSDFQRSTHVVPTSDTSVGLRPQQCPASIILAPSCPALRLPVQMKLTMSHGVVRPARTLACVVLLRVDRSASGDRFPSCGLLAGVVVGRLLCFVVGCLVAFCFNDLRGDAWLSRGCLE